MRCMVEKQNHTPLFHDNRMLAERAFYCCCNGNCGDSAQTEYVAGIRVGDDESYIGECA